MRRSSSMKEASLLHFCLWDTPYIPHTESDSSKRMYNSINLAAHAKVFIPKSQGFQFVIGVEFGGMFAVSGENYQPQYGSSGNYKFKSVSYLLTPSAGLGYGFKNDMAIELGIKFAFFDMKEIPIPGIYLTYRS